MSESSNKLCNRYDVLAWGGAVLTLISLAVLPASSVSNLFAAVFAFMSVVGFLMMYMRENFIGSLLVLSGFFVVIFLFAMQSDNSELAGTAYLANFGSYFGGVMTPIGLFVAFWAVRKHEESEKRKIEQKKVDIEIKELFKAFDVALDNVMDLPHGEDLVNGRKIDFFRAVFSSETEYRQRKKAMDYMRVHSFIVRSYYESIYRNYECAADLIVNSEANYASKNSVEYVVRYCIDIILSASTADHYYGCESFNTEFTEKHINEILSKPSGQLFLATPSPQDLGLFYNSLRLSELVR